MRFRALVTTSIAMAIAINASAATRYVDIDNVSGTEDGLTWATAFTDIQSGVDSAVQTIAANTEELRAEVWVAEGTYTATTDPVLTMKEDVHIYGGFTGTETVRTDRDWTLHETIIDGEAARRCVIGEDNATLDGFTVRNGSTAYPDYGGGMYNSNSSPTVTNCTFANNSSGYGGGGMYNSDCSPTISKCVFSDNTANICGGAIFNTNSSPTITNCIFVRNSATQDYGAAICNQSSAPVLINCTFVDNAVVSPQYPDVGGAIHNVQSSVTATNCIFRHDSPTELGGSESTVTYSCVEGGYDGEGNIDVDPQFMDVDGGDLRLRPGSPCIDIGTNVAAPADDFEGESRPFNQTVDIGADECHIVDEPPVCSAIPDITFDEDTTNESLELDGIVDDADNADEEIIWTWYGNTNVTVSVDDATRVVTFGAVTDWHGSETLTFRATDLFGRYDETTVTVSVQPVSEYPIIAAGFTDITTDEDEPRTIDLAQYATDDDDTSATLTWGLDNLIPSLVDVQLVGNSMYVTPALNQYGTGTIRLTLTDSESLSVSRDVTVTVNPINDVPLPPSASIAPNPAHTSDELVCTLTSPGSDVETANLQYRYTWTKSGGFSIVHGPTTEMADTLSASATAKHQVWTCDVETYDGESYSSPAEVHTSIVNAPPGPPSISLSPTDPRDEDDLVCRIVSGSDDLDGDTVSYTFNWFRSADGSTFTPAEADLSTNINSRIFDDVTNEGETWRCVVTPRDGEDSGESVVADVLIGAAGIETTITAYPSATEVVLGDVITVSGTITPPEVAAFRPVEVQFTSPQATKLTRQTVTGSAGTYTVEFEPPLAGDWTFNAYTPEYGTGLESTSDTGSFATSPGQTQVSVNVDSSAVILSGTVNVAGRLYADPSVPDQSILAGATVTLKKLDPASASSEETTETDSNGFYEFTDVTLPSSGRWSLSVGFAGDDNLLPASSDSLHVDVKTTAGYAVLVCGQLNSESTGLDSHMKTTNRVYHKLIERGFTDDNILYYSNVTDSGDPEVFVDGPLLKSGTNGIQDAIETWARTKMNNDPAPLYLIFVDHGGPDKFYIYNGGVAEDNYITPVELDGWLDTLEASLNATAFEMPRVFIYGACYSGSFIPDVSDPGRVVITSATATEESYKGPLDVDGIRDGEYFVTELFRDMGLGQTLKQSFERAVAMTEIFTQNPEGSNGGDFPDNGAQHPLLDDNADGIGTHYPLSTSIDLDGGVSNDVVLGFGMNSGESVDIDSVTSELVLDASAPAPVLTARVSDFSRADRAWIEVKTPNFVIDDDGTGSTVQKELNLPRLFSDTQDADSSSFEWTDFGQTGIDNFATVGRYEILYFVKDLTTKEVSPLKRTIVYRTDRQNNPPGSFNLLSVEPLQDETTSTTPVLDWQDSIDPDGEPVTYRVEISTDDSFPTANTVVLDNIGTSKVFVGSSRGLNDLTDYFWRVIAMDGRGGMTLSSQTMSFRTDNTTNTGIAASLFGRVVDLDTGELISSAVVRLDPAYEKSAHHGVYFFALDPDVYFVHATAPGYEPSEPVPVELGDGAEVRLDLGLRQSFQYYGDVNGDTHTDAIDVQLIINAALGLDVDFDCDINGDGTVNAIDVQLVTNAALGIDIS